MAVDDETGGGNAELREAAWSVARLNDEIAAALADAGDRFPTYVIGEVSGATAKSYGTFFTLRDVDGEETIQCIAWSSHREQFDAEVTEGETAIVRASVDFYTDGGRTQLSVTDYWPVGDSERSRELEALRVDLDAEGLFDDARKRPLPQFPTNIGVVTSLTGSAREDFREAAWSRAPGVTLTFFGATVQGANAPASLVGAVRRADRDPDIDVVVVTRGGGADATLWCFNEEPVVRVIADCVTPTVVAVGHEDDETLAELVADRRAMTPTDAGIVSTPDMASVRDRVGVIEDRLTDAYGSLVEDRLEAFDRRIETGLVGVERATETRRARIQRAADLEQRIATAYETRVMTKLEDLDGRIDAALRDLEHAAETDAVTARAARGRVAGLEARIDRAYDTHVEGELDALERRIESAHREVEADARVREGTKQARRLRIVVLVLVALLLIGAALWAAGLL